MYPVENFTLDPKLLHNQLLWRLWQIWGVKPIYTNKYDDYDQNIGKLGNFNRVPFEKWHKQGRIRPSISMRRGQCLLHIIHDEKQKDKDKRKHFLLLTLCLLLWCQDKDKMLKRILSMTFLPVNFFLVNQTTPYQSGHVKMFTKFWQSF